MYYIQDNPFHIINAVCIFAKQFIYRAKLSDRNVNVHKSENELELFQQTEWYSAHKTVRVNKHINDGAQYITKCYVQKT